MYPHIAHLPCTLNKKRSNRKRRSAFGAVYLQAGAEFFVSGVSASSYTIICSKSQSKPRSSKSQGPQFVSSRCELVLTLEFNRGFPPGRLFLAGRRQSRWSFVSLFFRS